MPSADIFPQPTPVCVCVNSMTSIPIVAMSLLVHVCETVHSHSDRAHNSSKYFLNSYLMPYNYKVAVIIILENDRHTDTQGDRDNIEMSVRLTRRY